MIFIKRLTGMCFCINFRYYSADGNQPAEDAYDMRKSMPRDKTGETSKPTGKKIKVSEVEFP
jgi:hypothetical protein